MVNLLVISEKWIRERLNLTIDTLGDYDPSYINNSIRHPDIINCVTVNFFGMDASIDALVSYDICA